MKLGWQQKLNGIAISKNTLDFLIFSPIPLTTVPRHLRCAITSVMLFGLPGAVKAQLSAITSFVYIPKPDTHHSLVSLPASAVVSRTRSTGSRLARKAQDVPFSL